jgi:hypothetical protein
VHKVSRRYNLGIGATDELSLRVSVATLVRVVFRHPLNGEWMLALERKATLHADKVEVKSQPFGGAVRILDLNVVHDLIGDFHFDSERSRAEQDFRIFIRPTDWLTVRELCIEHFNHIDNPILETDPTRELTEEFADALKISLRPNQYIDKPVATVVENDPAPTENIQAKGVPTVRVFRIFEATVSDPSLASGILKNSEGLSDRDLRELVIVDAQNGGKGRANAILALPLKQIGELYSALSLQERNVPISFENNRLDETVPAVLEGITVRKYQRL